MATSGRRRPLHLARVSIVKIAVPFMATGDRRRPPHLARVSIVEIWTWNMYPSLIYQLASAPNSSAALIQILLTGLDLASVRSRRGVHAVNVGEDRNWQVDVHQTDRF
jgi:hypothetical protein